jgi:hypothetical protein
VIVSWSGGKDSALLLHHLRRDPQYEVIGLVTTVTSDYDRISVHGIRRASLDAQVTRLDLPLYEGTIPAAASNAAYEAAFLAALARALVSCGVGDRSATQSVGQRSPKTMGPVRAPRFVLRHWHSPAAFDRIGGHGPANITANKNSFCDLWFQRRNHRSHLDLPPIERALVSLENRAPSLSTVAHAGALARETCPHTLMRRDGRKIPGPKMGQPHPAECEPATLVNAPLRRYNRQA